MKKIFVIAAILSMILSIVLINAGVFQDLNKNDFDSGTYNFTFYNSSGFIQLNSSALTGAYTSRIFDAGNLAIWNNLTKNDYLPFIDILYGADVVSDIWQSTDSGVSWTKINDDYNNGDGNGVTEMSVNSSGSLFITYNQQLWKSDNSGISWTKASDDVNGAGDSNAVAAMAIDNNNNIFIIDNSEDVLKSTDSGTTFTKVNNSDFNNGNGAVFGLVSSSTGILFSVDAQSDVWKSTNSGVSWTLVKDDYNGAEGNGGNDLVINSSDSLFIINGQDIWQSIDSGTTWTKINDDFNNGADSNNGITGIIDLNNTFYIADGSEDIYKSNNFSSVFTRTIENLNIASGNIKSLVSLRKYSNLTIQARNCSQPDCSDGIFSNINLNNMNLTSRYFQYKTTLISPDTAITPKLYNISIEYSILDSIPPSFSNYIENPSNNSGYSVNQIYRFNITATDNTGINSIWIEFNGINYTSIQNISNIYFFNKTDLAVGTYYYKWWANDSFGNINSSETRYYSISKGTNTLTLTSSDGWADKNYGTQASFSCSALYGSPNLYIDNSEVSNPVSIFLSAGSHNIKCNISENQNYSSEISQGTLTINKASALTAIIATPSSPIIYGNLSNFSCSNSAGLSTILYINGVDKSVEKSLYILRSGGDYNLNCTSVENQNYTSSSSQENYIINKIDGQIRLYLNSNENNLTIDYPEKYNITATTLYGAVSIYKDGIDITSENELAITPSRNAAYYNITAVSAGDENHSSASITRWLNVTLDTLPPSIDLLSPQEGESYGTNISLNLKYSVTDEHLDSCWYNINNGNNYSIENCQNTTFNVGVDGNYVLNLYSNDTLGNTAIKNVNFSVFVGAPSITLSSPIGIYLNNQSITFRYIPSDLDLRSCELWGDFDGEFKLNQTTNTPISNAENIFYLNLPDRTYKWNIRCNDSIGNSAFNGNKTFYIDTISPSISINSPNGKQTSRNNIPLTFSASDTSPISCIYNVYRGTNIEVQNTTINCTAQTSFNVTVDADFIVNLYITDSAGNKNFASSSFSVDTSAPVSNPSSGGGSSGGGGGVSLAPSSAKINLEITPIEAIIYPGEENSLQLTVKNIGSKSVNKCRIKSSEGQETWIYTTEIKNIAAGEIVEFPFRLTLPKNALPQLYLVCLEGNESIPLKVTLLESTINVKISKILLEKNNEIRIEYTAESNSDISTNLIFSVYKQKEKIKEQTQEISLKKDQAISREIIIKVEGIQQELLKISISEQGEEKPLIEESIVYGPKITGSALNDLMNGTTSSIIIIVVLFSLFSVFIIIRIIRNIKNNNTVYSGKIKKYKTN